MISGASQRRRRNQGMAKSRHGASGATRFGLACVGALALASSCNMPQPPIPTKLFRVDTPAQVRGAARALSPLQGAALARPGD